jgi:hypothetical protein
LSLAPIEPLPEVPLYLGSRIYRSGQPAAGTTLQPGMSRSNRSGPGGE